MSSSYLGLLESLRSRYQLPAFPDPLPSTQFHMELENGLTLTIDWHPETEQVEFFATIGTYNPERELQVMKTLMHANYLWAATAGGTLSARPDLQTIYLAYQTPIAAFPAGKESEFVTLVEKFGAVASDWKILLQELSEEKITSQENQEVKNS
jgi:hypothetical protein